MIKLRAIGRKKLLYLAILIVILFWVLSLFLPAEDTEGGDSASLKKRDTGLGFFNVATKEAPDNTNNVFVGPEGAVGESYILPPPTPKELTRKEVMPHLPIYLNDFETSIGIKTQINIYSLSGDPLDTIRVEIYGIDYGNRDVDPKRNPQIIAFKESFVKAQTELEKVGVSMNDINIIYGDKKYIGDTTRYWIQTFNLL